MRTIITVIIIIIVIISIIIISLIIQLSTYHHHTHHPAIYLSYLSHCPPLRHHSHQQPYVLPFPPVPFYRLMMMMMMMI
jgi:amino acid transporter